CSAFQAAFVLYFPPQVTLLLTCGYENMAFQATGLSRTQVNRMPIFHSSIFHFSFLKALLYFFLIYVYFVPKIELLASISATAPSAKPLHILGWQ
ncbi:MAG: hypothetical protein LBM67_08840, partial [Lentimicrobiaceae bacterium]|nr:hypothetical protein [Lentimicrobiaceae bacterium]